MNNYQNSLVSEHASLVIRINHLQNYIYSKDSDKDDKVEFANKCIQLASMKKYEEALRARIENTGIIFEDNEYYERVGSIEPILSVSSISVDVNSVIPKADNDYDKDKNCENYRNDDARYLNHSCDKSKSDGK